MSEVYRGIVVPMNRHEEKSTISRIQVGYCGRTLGYECSDIQCSSCLFDGGNINKFKEWYEEETKDG